MSNGNVAQFMGHGNQAQMIGGGAGGQLEMANNNVIVKGIQQVRDDRPGFFVVGRQADLQKLMHDI